MDLDDLTLSNLSQAQNDKDLVLFVESKKTDVLGLEVKWLLLETGGVGGVGRRGGLLVEGYEFQINRRTTAKVYCTAG